MECSLCSFAHVVSPIIRITASGSKEFQKGWFRKEAYQKENYSICVTWKRVGEVIHIMILISNVHKQQEEEEIL